MQVLEWTWIDYLRTCHWYVCTSSIHKYKHTYVLVEIASCPIGAGACVNIYAAQYTYVCMHIYIYMYKCSNGANAVCNKFNFDFRPLYTIFFIACRKDTKPKILEQRMLIFVYVYIIHMYRPTKLCTLNFKLIYLSLHIHVYLFICTYIHT